MKKMIRFLTLVLMCGLFLGNITTHAGEPWEDVGYRIMDMTDELTEDELYTVTEAWTEYITDCGVDLALMSLGESELMDTTPEEWGENLYEENSLGYGDTRDCFVVLYLTDAEEARIMTFGNAASLVPESTLQEITDALPEYYLDQGTYGVMMGAIQEFRSCLGGSSGRQSAAAETDASAETEAGGETEASAETEAGAADVPAGAVSGMPAWYPADPASAPRFFDPDAPRVVDEADIFTDEEEKEMDARLKEIREELDRDIVVYTNMSACGLDRKTMAADFFRFNGYGCGDDYEGAGLYICMDPENRGWVNFGHGPDSQSLYTEWNTRRLDDRLRPYLQDGQYGDGAKDWIENVRTLYLKGVPFAPDWLPDRGEEPERFHDSAAPRVDDTLGILTADQVSTLTEEAKKISDQYGYDVVIHTTTDRAEFSDMYENYYYASKGYGSGEEYDGVLVTLYQDSAGSVSPGFKAFGNASGRISSVNYGRLFGFLYDHINSASDFYPTVRKFLKKLSFMERTGRVFPDGAFWFVKAFFGALAGSVVGFISLIKAKFRMRTPGEKTNVNSYLVRDSLKIETLEDQFLERTTSRTYDPPDTRSSGGDSGSSYSDSFSDSSGDSGYSGSDNDF